MEGLTNGKLVLKHEVIDRYVCKGVGREEGRRNGGLAA